MKVTVYRLGRLSKKKSILREAPTDILGDQPHKASGRLGLNRHAELCLWVLTNFNNLKNKVDQAVTWNTCFWARTGFERMCLVYAGPVIIWQWISKQNLHNCKKEGKTLFHFDLAIDMSYIRGQWSSSSRDHQLRKHQIRTNKKTCKLAIGSLTWYKIHHIAWHINDCCCIKIYLKLSTVWFYWFYTDSQNTRIGVWQKAKKRLLKILTFNCGSFKPTAWDKLVG